jgi:hypothetical protein
MPLRQKPRMAADGNVAEPMVLSERLMKAVELRHVELCAHGVKRRPVLASRLQSRLMQLPVRDEWCGQLTYSATRGNGEELPSAPALLALTQHKDGIKHRHRSAFRDTVVSSVWTALRNTDGDRRSKEGGTPKQGARLQCASF